MHASSFVFQSQPTVYTEPLGHVQSPPASVQTPGEFVSTVSTVAPGDDGGGEGTILEQKTKSKYAPYSTSDCVFRLQQFSLFA